MKKLLKMKKGIVVGAAAVVVVAATAVVLILTGGKKKNPSYRTIAVHEATGTTLISTDSKENGEAYVGRHLYSGDDAKVQPEAELTLILDNNKYVYAEENTHFWLEASGTEKHGKTSLHVEEGDTLHYLQEDLNGDESYEVTSPAATMAVRGTVFRVYAFMQDGEYYTLLEVYQGRVEVSLKTTTGTYNGIVRTVEAGERALMRAGDDFSEFVEPGSASERCEIAYREIPQSMALHLGDVIDMGETLSITKELLYDYVELVDHRFTQEVTEEPTCTENGTAHMICEICGLEGEDVVLPAWNHSHTEWIVTEEGNCTQEGMRQEICSDCGEILHTEVIEAGHVYSDWETGTEATCTRAGERRRVCEVCGEEETERIRATGHDYGDWTVEREATCTTDGVNVRTCSVCGRQDTETVVASGHTYGDWTVIAKATCSAEGSKARVCRVCNHMETEFIARVDHFFGAWMVISSPTCAVTGTSQRKCSECGYAESQAIPMIAHTFGEWDSYVADNTCEEDSYRYRICSVCEYEERVVTIPATGHKLTCAHEMGNGFVICMQTCDNGCGYYETETINDGEACPYCGINEF